MSLSVGVLPATSFPPWSVLRSVALYQFTSSPMQSHVSRATVPRFLRKHDMMDVSGARLSPITGHTGYMRRWDSTSNNCSCGTRPHRPAFKTQKRPASVP